LVVRDGNGWVNGGVVVTDGLMEGMGMVGFRTDGLLVGRWGDGVMGSRELARTPFIPNSLSPFPPFSLSPCSLFPVPCSLSK